MDRYIVEQGYAQHGAYHTLLPSPEARPCTYEKLQHVHEVLEEHLDRRAPIVGIPPHEHDLTELSSAFSYPLPVEHLLERVEECTHPRTVFLLHEGLDEREPLPDCGAQEPLRERKLYGCTARPSPVGEPRAYGREEELDRGHHEDEVRRLGGLFEELEECVLRLAGGCVEYEHERLPRAKRRLACAQLELTRIVYPQPLVLVHHYVGIALEGEQKCLAHVRERCRARRATLPLEDDCVVGHMREKRKGERGKRR